MDLGAKTFLSLASAVTILVAQDVYATAVTNGDPPPPKSSAPDSSRPMIIQNPDGTFTVQKQLPPGKDGLQIPPQVVVPIVPCRNENTKGEDDQRRCQTDKH